MCIDHQEQCNISLKNLIKKDYIINREPALR